METGQIFRQYQDQKIAIYGLGVLTEQLLKCLEDYEVLCLLDGYRTNGALYGKPILSMEEAAAKEVQLIIVAARPESCKVIARRVGDFCKQHGMILLDIHGNDLCAPKQPTYHFDDISGTSKEQLKRLICTHDVVSTDLFDTLVMRRTLFPTDVFEMVALRLAQEGIVIDDFPQKRLACERELGKNTVPTLFEIYSYMTEQYSITSIRPEELAQLEWETDCALVIPRKELCILLEEVHRQGKSLYIVSDTFYSKNQLSTLLRNCGIIGYTDILTSCDYGTTKAQGLFMKLRERIPGKSCLHIGDSADADIKAAERNGYTACQLYSGLELFEKTGYLGLWEKIGSLSSRIQTGMLAANLFNSPFQFEDSDHKLCVADAYDIGYLFLGPVVTGFVIWLFRQVQKQHLKNIWFCARDGYLIKKLYDQLDSSTNTAYFLTSRFAAIRAGMESEEDIRYVEEMRFSGSLQEQLQERFGIAVTCEDCTGKSCLLDFKEELLEAAKVHRKHYCNYIQSLDPAEDDIAFFDFVARGTVQMYIERLLNRHLKGFYFSRLDQGYMQDKNLDILPFYEIERSNIFQNFYVLETVVTAPHPPVLGFDEHGNALFASETRSKRDMECIERVQEGVMDYFRIYRILDPAWELMEEKGLEEAILSLISKIEIGSGDFLALRDEDPFFHRTTEVSELL